MSDTSLILDSQWKGEVSSSILEEYKPSDGINISRKIFVVKGSPRRFIKISTDKSKNCYRQTTHERAAYLMSKNLNLPCIPKTKYYSSGKEARKAVFPDDPSFAFLDQTSEEVIIQNEVVPSLVFEGKGQKYKQEQAKTINLSFGLNSLQTK